MELNNLELNAIFAALVRYIADLDEDGDVFLVEFADSARTKIREELQKKDKGWRALTF